MAVIVILGASRGIGAATARMFAHHGDAVLLAARDADACVRLAASIKQAGGRAQAQHCDVTCFAQVQATVDHATRLWGGVDVLVNNAGIIRPIATLSDSDPQAVAESFAINLLGTYHGMRAALPTMQAQGHGVIINISSGAAHRPLTGWSAYCAGKAGAAMLTRSAALEAEGSGVRIVGFRPGTVDTAIQSEIRASGLNPISNMRPEDHFRPWQPAHVIAWLASESAADLHGQEVDIRTPEIQERSGLQHASPPPELLPLT